MKTSSDELSERRNHRRAPRIERKLDVALKFPDREQRFQTRDISYLGVFIECPEPLPLRKLVRLHASLTPGEEPLQLLGLVAHRVNSADAVETGRPSGMGIHLFGVSAEAREAWREYVRREYAKSPKVLEEVRAIEVPRIKLRFPNLEELRTFADQHVAKGHVFIRSAELYPQGARVVLDAIHPQLASSRALEAIVTEFVETPRQNRGMRLQFPDPDAARDLLLELAAG